SLRPAAFDSWFLHGTQGRIVLGSRTFQARLAEAGNRFRFASGAGRRSSQAARKPGTFWKSGSVRLARCVFWGCGSGDRFRRSPLVRIGLVCAKLYGRALRNWALGFGVSGGFLEACVRPAPASDRDSGIPLGQLWMNSRSLDEREGEERHEESVRGKHELPNH